MAKRRAVNPGFNSPPRFRPEGTRMAKRRAVNPGFNAPPRFRPEGTRMAKRRASALGSTANAQPRPERSPQFRPLSIIRHGPSEREYFHRPCKAKGADTEGEVTPHGGPSSKKEVVAALVDKTRMS